MQIEHDLPYPITDDELRKMEPELTRVSEQRTAEAIARWDTIPPADTPEDMQAAILADIATAEAGGYPSMEVDKDTPDSELDAFLFGDQAEIIEYEQMAPSAQAIVDGGNVDLKDCISMPMGMTREEMSAWLKEQFGV
jgi:hypothetical protein